MQHDDFARLMDEPLVAFEHSDSWTYHDTQPRHADLDELMNQILHFEQAAQQLQQLPRLAEPPAESNVNDCRPLAKETTPAQRLPRQERVFQHWPTNGDQPDSDVRPQCFKHGCNGRVFSSTENYRRHVRERTGSDTTLCPLCFSSFSRRSNLDTHLARGRCRTVKRWLEEIPPPIQQPQGGGQRSRESQGTSSGRQS